MKMVSKTTIQEANKHLHAMHLHSTFLENSLQECREIMKQNEEKYCNQIQTLRKEKDVKITELTMIIKRMEEEKKVFETRFKEKENEIRLLKGRLSVFNQIFQFLPGLRSFVGVIDNARRLTIDNNDEKESDDMSPKEAIKAMNISVPSLAKHTLSNEKLRNLSVSDDSDDDVLHKKTVSAPIANGPVKLNGTEKSLLHVDEKTAEVFL